MPRFRFKQGQFYHRLAGNDYGSRLLFLHGFLGSGEDFSPIIKRLAPEFCCLSLDIPGHGKTEVFDQVSGYGMAAIAEGLIQFINKLDYAPCYLVGYSMGGRLALYLACHFPQYFSGVFLESASPGLATALERTQRQQQDEALAIALETGSWPDFVRGWYAQPLFSTLKNHPLFEILIQKRFNNRPAELARSLRGMGTGVQPSLWEALSDLRLPLTLMVGALDSKFMAINQEMVTRCPSAQLVTLPNCGHMAHFEAPAMCIDILRRRVLKG